VLQICDELLRTKQIGHKTSNIVRCVAFL
jgi:hypothetical protein